ncbi:MAG TPA: YdbH domain-containing protein [Dongiaceae bacterium]|nr:YdbH domain-containing protein [Dongiaceae bacterium]
MSVAERGRAKRFWLIAILAVVIAGIAVAWNWRGGLTGWLAESYLHRQFRLGTTVAVNDVDFDSIQLSEFRLGDHDEAVFKDIRVDYALNGLSAPILLHVEIGDATLHLGYDGRLQLGSLQRLIRPVAHDQAAGKPLLPIIILHHLAILLDTPVGQQRIQGMATYDKDTLFTNLNWTEPNGGAHMSTTATIRNVSTQMAPEGQLQATIMPQSQLWQLLPAVAPKAGLISFQASLGAGNSDTPGPRVQVDLSAQGIALPQLPAPIDLHVVTTLQTAGDEVMPPQATPKTFVFRDFAVDFKGGPSGSFTGTISNGSGTIDLRQQPQATGDFALDMRDQSLPLGGITLKEPTASLKLHAQYDGARLLVTPTETGKLTLLDLSGAPVTFPSLLTLAIQPNGSQFSWVLDGADQDHRLADPISGSLALGDIKAQVLPTGQKTVIGLTATAPKLSFGGDPTADLHGKVTLQNLQATRQALLALMANLQLDFTANPGAASGTANLAVSDIEMPNVIAPLRLTAKANLKDMKADISATLTEPKSKTPLLLSGTYNLAQHAGRGHIDFAPPAFAANGWQPTDLAPILGRYMRDIGGAIAVKGDVTLTPDNALNSDINLALSNISGRLGPAVVQNLNSVIHIDRLWPFSTSPGQSLAVEQIVLGLPFTNGLLQFDIDDGKTIKIASGALNLANGQVSLDPTTLSTDAPVQQLNLKVDHLGVDQLFKLINIAGLDGDGEIAGAIPVSLFPDGVIIKGAKLAATRPGTLRYDTGAAPAAVKNAGDSVNMALSALSDFQYKELVITLERQLTGDASLGLHISGSNPKFYNGYPVEFNFTASGRLDEILRQGLAGYQVPDMIEEKLNQFH